MAMQETSDMAKHIAVKAIGSKLPTRNLTVMPGTSTSDVLTELGLDAAGFQLAPARYPEQVFQADDNLYARVEEGELLHASSKVDAGN